MNEDTNTKSSSLRETILKKIEQGAVKMKSKKRLMAEFLLIVFVAAVIFLLSAFILSFVLFSLSESREFSLLRFGSHGIKTFLLLFPWALLGVELLLLFILEVLLRRFRFGYRRSLLRVFGGIFLICILATVVIDVTPLHPNLLSHSERDELPFLGRWYEELHQSHKERGVFWGTVDSIQDSAFTIIHNDGDHDLDDRSYRVIPPEGSTVLRSLEVGDKVYIAGSLNDGTIKAYGITQIREEDNNE